MPVFVNPGHANCRPGGDEAGPQGVVATSISMLRRVRDAAPAGVRDAVGGVGIAAPGPLDLARGALLEPPNMPRSFRGAPLVAPIAAALSLPVALERDTHVAALAEWEYGATRGLTVQVADENCKPVENASVSFQLPSDGPSGSFPDSGKSAIVTTGA